MPRWNETRALNLELSAREKEVLEAANAGEQYKEIAKRLGISVYTVGNYLDRARDKQRDAVSIGQWKGRAR